MGGRTMNLRPSKKTIRDFFVHFGWGILGGGLLSFLVLDFSLRAIDAIQPREKLDFFIESYALKENTLAEDMLALKTKGFYSATSITFIPKKRR